MANSALATPAIEVRRDFDLPRTPPVAPSPLSPVKIGLGGRISVKGVVTPPNSTTKVSFAVGRADVEKTIQTDFGFVKFKQQVVPGQVSKISIEIGKTGFPLTMELSANADYTRPISISVKWPRLIELRGAKLSLAGSGIAGDYTFTGTLDPQINIDIAMNELWPGWPNILRLTADQSRLALRAGASAVRSVFFADAEGLVTVTTTGAAAFALTIGVASLAWVAFGVYECGKALRDGQTMAARYSFCNGYARILAEMTSDTTTLRQGEVVSLLSMKNWQAEFARCIREYLTAANDLAAIHMKGRLETLGQAAIALDIDRFVRESPSAWRDVRRRHQAAYGTDKETRRRRYIQILYQQVQSNAARIGIPLR